MIAKSQLALLTLANILTPLALLIFATGFFPYKPLIPGRANFRYDDHNAGRITAPFEKVIFMVVDALRSDFVYSHSSGFDFVQSLIRSGAATPFTAHATSPTITMPRVKAITTGSIPSFLDVILNFAESDTTSSLSNQDTWLSQLKDKPGGKLVMYGDDTWLKLFPDTFARADGTSSFFVSDFTEVDNNVTRHIPRELEQDDWNGMVLHYLGLDHIGHKSGPKSQYMKPKQAEMDAIVRQIYTAILTKRHLHSTLLVLCGDHGMNDAGNHGGSAEGETSPALVFLSPKFQAISEGKDCPMILAEPGFEYYKKVEQSDIAPTLAGLLGFPVPLNNLGVFIPELLSFWPEDTRLHLMLQNARQILNIVRLTFPNQPFDGTERDCIPTMPDSDEKDLSCIWSNATRCVEDERCTNAATLKQIHVFCKRAQQILSTTASNYNTYRLNWGIAVAIVSFLLILETAIEPLVQATTIGLWIGTVSIAYAVMMFASSYVEEEQHFWYWTSSAWLCCLFIKRQSAVVLGRFKTVTASLCLLSALRVVRVWNQTGQKHAGEADIAGAFLPAHSYLLWLLILATYLDVIQRVSRRAIPWASRQFTTAVSVLLGIAALGFKIAFTNADAPELLISPMQLILDFFREMSLVLEARVVFLYICFMALMTLLPAAIQSSSRKVTNNVGFALPLHDLLTLLLITQSRATNVPLFLLFEGQYLALDHLRLTSVEITISSLLFQYSSFFAFGGSNAISSVDLSNAYNGVSGYNVVTVGILTFISNWAGPIWWTSATMMLLSRNSFERQKTLKQHLSLSTAFVSCSVLAVMLACAALRTHLFIWTVFSPKFLYSMAWSLGQHLSMTIGFGSLMYWIASW